MRAEYDIAIVGATGAVGETILELLDERNFPIGDIYAVASNRSAGTRAVSYTHLTLPTNREV